MAHKCPIARREYQREYKRRMRQCPIRAEKEREKERDLYARTKDATAEARRAKNARYREKHRAELAAKERSRNAAKREEDPDSFFAESRDRARQYRDRNKSCPAYKERNREYARRRYQKMKDCPRFKEINSKRAGEWVKENRERFNAGARDRRRKRYSSDLQYRMEISLRRRLYMAVKNNHSSGLAVMDLGIRIPDFISYIESLFEDGMSWSNWGVHGWHLDHIIPISKFDLSDQGDVSRACHYTNIQPLWAKENLSKGAKVQERKSAEVDSNGAH